MRRGSGHRITVLVVMLTAMLFSMSQAAETWISKSGGVANPGKAALLPDGGIAVTSPVWNSIGVLDHNGTLLGSRSSKHPAAIAAGPDGKIFVALNKFSSNLPPYTTKGEVKAFDSKFNYLFSLGSGAGEFANPSDIEVAQDGTVYVTDLDANQVKVFNADGSMRIAFGASGTGDGFFNKPVAVSVDNATGDMYVADCQRRLNQGMGGTGYADGVRIQVFNKNGAFLRGFGNYGDLFSISDIAFSNGTLYVADNYLDLVQVYDAGTGLLQHGFNNPAGSIRLPSSLAISRDGILYVTGTGSNDVNMFGIDDFVLFGAAPKQLTFAAIVGMASPSPINVNIANSGNNVVSWTLSGESWITRSAAAGTLPAGGSDTVAIGVASSSLAVGQYNGKAAVTNQNGTSEYVSVGLTVINPPLFALSQQAISFAGNAGSTALLSQAMNVTLSGALPSSYWTARSTAGWLGVNPVQAGTSSSAVTVTASAAGLSVGTYTGQIVFESKEPAGVSAAVDVKLEVTGTGTINVATNLAEASFTITGGSGPYSGGGTSWSVSDVVDGTYTVTYAAVAGYATPKDETLAVTGGSTISFTGTYTDLRAAKNIVVSAGFNAKGPATIRVFSPDGQTLIQEFNPFGSKSKIGYNVAVGDIDGDGIRDIIVGLGKKNKFPARVAAFTNAGVPIAGADFIALDTRKGANVAAADFDGDGKDEIIVAAGPWSKNRAVVKIFSYDTATATMVDMGVDLTAFGSKYGANIAVGDINGDGKPELIVAPGPDPNAAPEVKAFAIDTTGGAGSWIATAMALDILPTFSSACGANIAAGDLNGDGVAEIIAASGTCASSRNELQAYNADGSTYALSLSDGGKGGLEVSAGDLNMDGKAEVVLSLGKRGNNNSLIRAYTSDGSLTTSFTAFDTRTHFGAKTALGELGY